MNTDSIPWLRFCFDMFAFFFICIVLSPTSFLQGVAIWHQIDVIRARVGYIWQHSVLSFDISNLSNVFKTHCTKNILSRMHGISGGFKQ